MTYAQKHPAPIGDYQTDFANRLIKAVGFEDAIRECYENQWLGTLNYIQRLQRQHQA